MDTHQADTFCGTPQLSYDSCIIVIRLSLSITPVLKFIAGVDEGACILLKYKSGAMASLTYHTNAGQGNNIGLIMGQEGNIKVGKIAIFLFWCFLILIWISLAPTNITATISLRENQNFREKTINPQQITQSFQNMSKVHTLFSAGLLNIQINEIQK